MKNRVKLFSILILFAVFAQAAKENSSKTINVNGTSRSYILYVPDNVSSNPALVFSLHGASGKSENYSPFKKEVADSKGCIVVYPQGATQYFAVFGGSTTGWAAYGEANEDLDFFKAIIDEVAKSYSIDKNRIYCCGFSNGGMMTYSNSNTASDIFAAFASISGYPINEMHHRHSGIRPVPFLHIHGKADDFVKYSLMGTIRDNMVARNGCNPVPTVTKGTNYTKSVYAAGEGSFPYIYYEIDGMGHNDFTSNTEDGSSALTMWNFLSKYKLSDACDKTLKWNPNLDKSGWDATQHGWTITDGMKYVYGDATTVQNVSHSLQFEKGSYQLRLETSGTSTNKITIKLASTSGTIVFYKYVNVGKKAYIPFTIPSYGEYTITITKDSSADKFVSLGAYMTTTAWSGAEEIKTNDVTVTTETVKKNVELTQTDYSTTLATMSTANGITTFVIKNNGDVEVVYKMLNVNVEGYNKVVVTFAEPTPVELLAAFGSTQPTLPQGTTTYTYDIPSGTTTLSEIALISLWKGAGTTIKVKSVELVGEKEIADEGSDTDEQSKTFSLLEGKFIPNIFAGEGSIYKYTFDANTHIGTFYAGQYGFGGWRSSEGFDVSDYRSIVVEFAEPALNGVSFRYFNENNYWGSPVAEIDCGGKKTVTADISNLDKLYIVGFWDYGNTTEYSRAIKIKSVTLVPFARGDINKDGKVDIEDVRFLTDMLLNKEKTVNRADINDDTSVSISDLPCLINILK